MQRQLLNASRAVTIANGAALSSAADLERETLVGIQIDATGWTGAALSFQGSADGVTWGELKDETTNFTTGTVAAGDYVDLPPVKFFGARYLKVRSGTAATPVNQAAARVLTLVTRAL